jgi:Zn-finger nucleic acid-binding protein
MSERQNIEIDFCPKCRGVWLDRGELDKIIERASATQAPPPPPQQPAPQPHYHQPYPQQRAPYYGKRKKSFLEELFD